MPIIYGNSPTGRPSKAKQRLTPEQIERDKLGMHAREALEAAKRKNEEATSSDDSNDGFVLTHKTCSVCHRLLPLDNFRRDKNQTLGRRSSCKVCERDSNAARWVAKQESNKYTDEIKTCLRCGHKLSLDMFGICVRQPGGRANVCHACASEAKEGMRICYVCGKELPQRKFSRGNVCRDCGLERRREFEALKLKELLADPNHEMHGTVFGYTCGCQCDKCKKANSVYRSELKARNKDRKAYYESKKENKND